jgi:uncharacterized protein YprB with RNaseH-like and TPR domain
MKLQEIIKLMVEKPVYIRMGKGKLSKRFKCSPEDIVRARREAKNIMKLNKYNGAPRILFFDIETTPMISYTWGRWNQNVSLDQTIQESYMLCWSASWLSEDRVFGDCLTSEEAIKGDDTRIIESLWYYVNEADILVAYNGDAFDVKKINGMFFLKGLNPPSPYKVVDPCKVARSKFNFSSNKMDALANYLGIPTKMHTDFNLWKECMNGDKESLNYMFEYNKKDVDILKQIYIKMLPYITNHPNVCNYIGDIMACTHCGETEKYEKLDGYYYYTNTNKYQVYRCLTCGSLFRDRQALKINKPKVI